MVLALDTLGTCVDVGAGSLDSPAVEVLTFVTVDMDDAAETG